MTSKRMILQKALENFQKEIKETPHVYFDPPESVKMEYPCFVYHFDDYNVLYGGDAPGYLVSEEYAVRYITKTSDAKMPKLLMGLPHVSYNTHYVSNNLHHYMFTFRSMFEAPDDYGVDLKPIAKSFLGGNYD